MINENSQNNYVGNGSSTIFPYTFKIFSANHIKVVTRGPDPGDLETVLTLGVDYTVSGVNNKNGGNITMLVAPEDLAIVVLLRNIPLNQNMDIRNQGDYYPEYIEDTFDRTTMMIQMVRDRLAKTLGFGDTLPAGFDPTMPPPEANAVIGFNDTATGLDVLPPSDFEGPPGPQGNPLFITTGEDPNIIPPTNPATPQPGDLCLNSEGIFYQFNGTVWEDTGVALQLGNAIVQGYSLRYGQEVDLQSNQAIADFIFQIGYQGPGVTLASAGSNVIREKGAATTAGELIATIVKRTNDIASAILYKNGSNIYTFPAPAAGPNSYTDGVQFTDNTSYRVDVRDVVAGGNGNTLAQSTVNYVFVYPYYAVGGAAGLPGNDIRAAADDANKKKVINTNALVTNTFTTVGAGVLYFAQPATYLPLTSILDSNGFETIGSWTASLKNITGLDGIPVSYRVYEFNNTLPSGSYGPFEFRR